MIAVKLSPRELVDIANAAGRYLAARAVEREMQTAFRYVLGSPTHHRHFARRWAASRDDVRSSGDQLAATLARFDVPQSTTVAVGSVGVLYEISPKGRATVVVAPLAVPRTDGRTHRGD